MAGHFGSRRKGTGSPGVSGRRHWIWIRFRLFCNISSSSTTQSMFLTRLLSSSVSLSPSSLSVPFTALGPACDVLTFMASSVRHAAFFPSHSSSSSSSSRAFGCADNSSSSSSSWTLLVLTSAHPHIGAGTRLLLFFLPPTLLPLGLFAPRFDALVDVAPEVPPDSSSPAVMLSLSGPFKAWSRFSALSCSSSVSSESSESLLRPWGGTACLLFVCVADPLVRGGGGEGVDDGVLRGSEDILDADIIEDDGGCVGSGGRRIVWRDVMVENAVRARER